MLILTNLTTMYPTHTILVPVKRWNNVYANNPTVDNLTPGNTVQGLNLTARPEKIYVATNGDSNGTHPNDPMSIEQALAVAIAGDHIYIQELIQKHFFECSTGVSTEVMD